jgi:hypothetical protein
MPSVKKQLVVAGDIIVDWNLARTQVFERSAALWEPDYKMRAYAQVGGAALIKDILKQSLKPTHHHVTLLGRYPSVRDLDPQNQRFSHSYAICSRSKGDVWQIENFLGFDKAQPKYERRASKRLATPDLILIDDGNAGFRDRFRNGAWPSDVPLPEQSTWILLKWARPDFRPKDGSENWLWKQLLEKYGEKLIVVFNANDLRLTEMQISRELSWEQTAQDVLREIQESSHLLRCAAIVVSFYTAGAIVYWNGKPSADCKLYYDPGGVEGEWFAKQGGRMAGYTQCLACGIAYSLIQQGVTPISLADGVRRGLSASRELHRHGFDADNGKPFPEKLCFPTKLIVNTIRNASDKIFLSEEIEQGKDWRIASFDNPERLAVQIIEEGPEAALKGMPICQFKDLVTIDREESESLRSISGLVAEYARNRSTARPLSIAIFGSPGSGKSFAVQQVIEALRERSDLKDELGRKDEQREFNISQFRNSDDLLGALHQIRDVALSGRIPLVFWDEFDTQLEGNDLGWLRYFLAPMQDGKFQQEQVTHMTGRAVFVFAGGTTSTRQQFDALAMQNAAAKGPDFLSRLKGYLDIPGLDHPSGSADPSVIIRRAILFRSMLKRRAVPDLFHNDSRQKMEVVDVDEAVTRAFLRVTKYKHGARSMDSIIAMSLLDGKRLFEQSSLPPGHLLDLHVDSNEFLSLVRQPYGSSR